MTIQTRANERREFLRRLRTQPLFLANHFGILCSAAYRKVINRVYRRYADVHRGRKHRPAWLGSESSIGAGGEARGAFVALPRYPQTMPCRAQIIASTAVPSQGSNEDPEAYFAESRWRFLMQEMLGAAPDWEGGIERCLQWIEAHPSKSDAGWETYSSCERVANLLVFMAAAPLPTRKPEALPALRSFVAESLQWVDDTLEYYGPVETNNHILNNARALVMGGVATDNPGAVRTGLRLFRQCLPEMVLRGGFLRERSSHYQLVVLNWLLDSWHFLASYRHADAADLNWLRECIAGMAEAAAMLCDDGGRLMALIGDVSPDATPEQSSDRLRALYPEWWPVARQSVAPRGIRDDWFVLAAGRARIVGNFPRGSYPPRFPTHGHCDASSFVWRSTRQDILVDPGRYRYTPDAISQFQRSAPAHNVPLINGFAPLCESLLGYGNWWPLPYANASLAMGESSDGIELEHNGFARCTPVTVHRRRISGNEYELRVVDTFEGRGSVWLELCWQFAEVFGHFDPQTLRLQGDGYQLSLKVQGVGGLPRVRFEHGGELSGWVSRAYGERNAAFTVRLAWETALPAKVTTDFLLQEV
jgi:hypothetical protein